MSNEETSTISNHEMVTRESHLGSNRWRVKCTCGWRSSIRGRLSAAQREWHEHKEAVALGEAREVA